MAGGLRTLDDVARELAILPERIGVVVGDHLRTEAQAIPAAARSTARGRMGRHAAGTVTFTPTTAGGLVQAGRDGSLGSVLLAGTEYGARGTKKVRYPRRSPRGKAHVVYRRTTRMFDPWVSAKPGYWWARSLSRALRGVVGRTSDVIETELSRG